MTGTTHFSTQHTTQHREFDFASLPPPVREKKKKNMPSKTQQLLLSALVIGILSLSFFAEAANTATTSSSFKQMEPDFGGGLSSVGLAFFVIGWVLLFLIVIIAGGIWFLLSE